LAVQKVAAFSAEKLGWKCRECADPVAHAHSIVHDAGTPRKNAARQLRKRNCLCQLTSLFKAHVNGLCRREMSVLAIALHSSPPVRKRRRALTVEQRIR
jgi:hypothetical protein